ncbi:MAG: tetratricopeptide repeat protein, partial [Thermodesulfobacteriota bacterium]
MKPSAAITRTLLLVSALVWPIETHGQADTGPLLTQAFEALGGSGGALTAGSSSVAGRTLARSLTERALALDPSEPEAHVRMGQVLYEQGHYAESVHEYRAAIRQRPGSSSNYTNLGIALEGMGDYDNAVAAHRASLKLEPAHAEAHNNLGNALKEKGD